jgi:predicted Zn-ribbon and HTH transcriptional regulator
MNTIYPTGVTWNQMGTVRQSIVFVLKQQEVTAKEISQAVGIREKEVYDHLAHIARSRSLGGKFLLIPSTCRECGHVFKKRDRLTPPGRCFLCRSEAISPPRFAIRTDPVKETRGEGQMQENQGQ